MHVKFTCPGNSINDLPHTYAFAIVLVSVSLFHFLLLNFKLSSSLSLSPMVAHHIVWNVCNSYFPWNWWQMGHVSGTLWLKGFPGHWIRKGQNSQTEYYCLDANEMNQCFQHSFLSSMELEEADRTPVLWVIRKNPPMNSTLRVHQSIIWHDHETWPITLGP